MGEDLEDVEIVSEGVGSHQQHSCNKHISIKNHLLDAIMSSTDPPGSASAISNPFGLS